MNSTKILAQALLASRKPKKSKLNKKWIRFLKNKKLFDEYMIYLASFHVVGVEPCTYKQLSILCYNLSTNCVYIEQRVSGRYTRTPVKINWYNEFREFAWESIKWYDLKNIFLYAIHNGYK